MSHQVIQIFHVLIIFYSAQYVVSDQVLPLSAVLIIFWSAQGSDQVTPLSRSYHLQASPKRVVEVVWLCSSAAPVFTSIRLVNLKTTAYVIWSCHSKTIALIIFRLVQRQVLTSFNLVTPLSLAPVIIFRLVQRLVESSFWPSHSTTKCVDVGCSHCALIGHTLNSFHLWLLRLSPYWIPTAQLWPIFFPQ